LLTHSNLIIVSGHYGVGKTSFCLNFSHAIRGAGKAVTLIDMDIVNPYFRSSDYSGAQKLQGIKTISPKFAGTTLENPSISGEVLSSIKSADENNVVIIDTGGDAEGIRAISRYSSDIKSHEYKMLYVINQKRLMTGSADEALEFMKEIELASSLKTNSIVNNTHLKQDTTIETAIVSMPFAIELSRISALPLEFVCVPKKSSPAELKKLKSDFAEVDFELLVMSDYTKTPWE
jgi:hypothetical protein